MSDILKHAKIDDPLQDATGGYAPDADTPTHFFGREATAKIAAQKKTARKKAAPVEPKLTEVKVAPGVVIAYEDTMKKRADETDDMLADMFPAPSDKEVDDSAEAKEKEQAEFDTWGPVGNKDDSEDFEGEDNEWYRDGSRKPKS